MSEFRRTLPREPYGEGIAEKTLKMRIRGYRVALCLPIHRDNMTEPIVTSETLDGVVALVQDVESGGEALPPDVREEYLEARQSIVDARRSAENDDKSLQLSW